MLRVCILSALLSATGAIHFEDPNVGAGCASDETKITVTGVTGNFCSPKCPDQKTCPTDVPTGVTATPTCTLHTQTGVNYCALICETSATNNTCGLHASCKPIQGQGICTYDDMPPLPSSDHWAPVDSPSFSKLSAIISVAFEPDGVVGFAGGGQNALGSQVIKSVDSGATWDVVYPRPDQGLKFDIFLSAATRDSTSAIIAGVIDPVYSTDGTNFSIAKDFYLVPSQCSKVLPDGTFAIVSEGPGNKTNGVATSADGSDWTECSNVQVSDKMGSRYGSFPTQDTWYISAGSWPGMAEGRRRAKAEGGHWLTSRVHVKADLTTEFVQPQAAASNGGDDEGFYAVVQKTTDGGKTWTNVFTDNGAGVYPNGISCPTTEHCVCVLEGQRGKIIVTRDGGKNWKVTMDEEDPAAALLDVHMMDEKEGWAAGGYMDPNAFEGRYWHTLDGGDTWIKEAIPGLTILSLDMVSEKSAYSVAFDLNTVPYLMKFKPGTVATLK